MVGVLFLCVKNMSVFLSVAPVEVVGRAGSVGRSKFPKQNFFRCACCASARERGETGRNFAFQTRLQGENLNRKNILFREGRKTPKTGVFALCNWLKINVCELSN